MFSIHYDGLIICYCCVLLYLMSLGIIDDEFNCSQLAKMEK